MTGDDSEGQQVPQGGINTGDSEPGSRIENPPSRPPDDLSTTSDGLRSDKQNDKPDDKLNGLPEDLLAVVESWPNLPGAVKQGIIAMVRHTASSQGNKPCQNDGIQTTGE